MTLILAPGVFDAIATHLCAAYPEEGCGLLLGTVDSAADRRTAFDCMATPNRWLPVEARRKHYLIEAEDVVRAERQARRAGWELIGVFHSHPDYAPMPSPEDREHAWPGLSYFIATVTASNSVENPLTPRVAKMSSVFCWVFDVELQNFYIETYYNNLSA
jgi:proteasome lid subunit RPN8/RPN11